VGMLAGIGHAPQSIPQKFSDRAGPTGILVDYLIRQGIDQFGKVGLGRTTSDLS
jgi:hypothetical protein